MKLMRLLCALAVLVTAACVPHPASASPTPRPSALVLSLAADTLQATIKPCDSDEPTVKCRVTLAGTVGATPIAFSAVGDVDLGATIVATATLTCMPLQVVTVTVTSRGLNRSGDLSAPRTDSATLTCKDGPPNVPRTIIIQMIVKPGS